MNVGDRVKFQTEDGVWLEGTIVNVYVVPKDYNLVDIDVDGIIHYGIETEACQNVSV